MDQLFKFDKMITPTIIKILFYIGMGISVIMGLGLMLRGYALGFLAGLLMAVGGTVAARVYCELFIIIFKIYDSIRNIERSITKLQQDSENRLAL